jgi:CRP-like cAMP-binding protein
MDFARDHRDSFGYYAVRYWLTDLAADDPASSRVRERIYAALKRAGIPLAVPAAHFWVEQDSEERRKRKRQLDEEKRLSCVTAVELFQPLQPEELASLADRILPAPFAAGEIITRQGAVAHWLYILAEGTVEVRVDVGGVEKTVAEIEAPSFFGEMGLMTGEPRRATVAAKTEVECYRLDKEALEQIVADRPAMAAEISEILAKRNVELDAAREDIDAAAQRTRIVEERRKLLATIESFFGLRDDDRRSTHPRT